MLVLIWIVFVLVGALLGAGISASFAYRRFGRSGPLPGAAPWRLIGVPLVNGAPPRSALAVAARLSTAGHGQVVLLAIVSVPRTMNLEVETPPGLEAALGRIEEAEALVRGHGARVHSEVIKVREATDILRRICTEIGIDVLVLEPSAGARAMTELMNALATEKRAATLDIVITHGRASDGVVMPLQATSQRGASQGSGPTPGT